MCINGTKTVQKLPWEIMPGDFIILLQGICLVLDNSRTWNLGECKYYDIVVVDSSGILRTTGLSHKWIRTVLQLNA